MSSYEIGECSSAIRLSSNKRRSGPRTAGRKTPPRAAYLLPLPSTCTECGAKVSRHEPPFFCCGQGDIHLAIYSIPVNLRTLFLSSNDESSHFRQYILSYNNCFSFNSFGVKKDKELARRDRGIYTFRVQGQVYHYINNIIPGEEQPKYLQLYFYDTDTEMQQRNEVYNSLLPSVIAKLMKLMEVNPYARLFRSLREMGISDMSQILIRFSPDQDKRMHNAPSTSQVAAIWVDSEDSTEPPRRNIIVHGRSDRSHRIQHYYGCYDPLQYPLLFPFGQTGWHQGIMKRGNHQHVQLSKTFPVNEFLVQDEDNLIQAEEQVATGQPSIRKVSCREYYCCKLQIRLHDTSFLLRCGRLLQQFVVDMYIKIEMTRLDFIRRNQETIRAELYQGIIDKVTVGLTESSNVGHRFILPPSFIGGPRDRRRRYLDAMSLVQRYGKPDILLTMTCNPNWPEIQEELLPNEQAPNRPDLVARVFRAKLMELKKDVIEKKLFGSVAAFVYVIEFQKRGLPHVHFLIILDSGSKIQNSDQYNTHVCAEIPDQDDNPHLHTTILKHMMHGSCGEVNTTNVCMKDGSCKNHYPRDYNETTSIGRNSYPIYRTRDNDRTAMVRGVLLDNQVGYSIQPLFAS